MPDPVISGVPTSVTAFVGYASSGPLNSATHLFSFGDFERAFGGLSASSEMSYAVYLFFLNGGSDAWIVRVEAPQDVSLLPAAFAGSRAAHEGLYALDAVDLFNLLCLPGIEDAAILAAAASYCRERQALLIIDAPRAAATPEQIVAVVTGGGLFVSDNAALYYPWIVVADPLNGGQARTTAPSGAVAGVFARIDAARGVWKAPAGLEATVSGAQALQYQVTDAQNGVLNPLGVNCICAFPRYGIVAWGARLLRPDDDPGDYKYVSVRRLLLFIECSVEQGLQRAVFEPNGSTLSARICAGVTTFLDTLFRQGALQGTSPRDAYFVRCGPDVTTQLDLAQGRVNVLIGCAALRPAEFVVIKIQVQTGQT